MSGGLGAWSFGPYKFRMVIPNYRVSEGVKSFKRELDYNGFAKGVILTDGSFGPNFRDGVFAFQNAEGLDPDGTIGPTTARHLFRKRTLAFELAHMIPDHLVSRQGTLESANDPVAQGYADANDEGWGQINSYYHPLITELQAWDPAFAIPWLGGQLITAFTYTGGDWEGGLAAYNIGWVYAKKWVSAGKPSAGFVKTYTHPDGSTYTIDWYERAFNYVVLVKKQPL